MPKKDLITLEVEAEDETAVVNAVSKKFGYIEVPDPGKPDEVNPEKREEFVSRRVAELLSGIEKQDRIDAAVDEAAKDVIRGEPDKVKKKDKLG